MARVAQGFGGLVIGAVLGAAVARGFEADAIWLGILGALGLMIFGGGWVYERRSDRTRSRRAAAQFYAILAVIHDGDKLLGSMVEWSKSHLYIEPSSQGSPSAVGADGQAKATFLAEAKSWTDRAERLVWQEFGTAATGFRLAPAVPPAANQYVHPHLEAAWGAVRGRITWLGNQIPQILPATPRSHRRSIRDWLPRRPSPGSDDTG